MNRGSEMLPNCPKWVALFTLEWIRAGMFVLEQAEMALEDDIAESRSSKGVSS